MSHKRDDWPLWTAVLTGLFLGVTVATLYIIASK